MPHEELKKYRDPLTECDVGLRHGPLQALHAVEVLVLAIQILQMEQDNETELAELDQVVEVFFGDETVLLEQVAGGIKIGHQHSVLVLCADMVAELDLHLFHQLVDGVLPSNRLPIKLFQETESELTAFGFFEQPVGRVHGRNSVLLVRYDVSEPQLDRSGWLSCKSQQLAFRG